MRKRFILWFIEISQKTYLAFKKKKSWETSRAELLTYPKESLGYKLGAFLKKHGFQLMPKVERHDAYHVLTGYGTKIQDEIALQYVCYGNGKRSLYLFLAILVGALVLPEYFRYYFNSYKLGKRCAKFHHFDYKKLLHYPLDDLRSAIFTKKQILKII